MPFHGYTGIPSPDAPDVMVDGYLLEWKVKENEFVQAGSTLAVVKVNNEEYDLRVCFPVLIMEKCAEVGESISKTKNILKWAADGESIPYGDKYFEIIKKNVY